MIINRSHDKKTIFTRMCISEAIIKLLQKYDFNKITVTNIVKTAGVARMTFYNYYNSSTAALKDYLQIIISEYVEDASKKLTGTEHVEYNHILHALNFFDKYAHFFLTLAKHNMHGILLDGINQFMINNVQRNKNYSLYELYSYAGGLLNSFLKWEEDGKKESSSVIAETIYKLYCRNRLPEPEVQP
ncbi:MAG: TetR/AcrR family transcriptional regulator [Lachnospiraceae bacterium]|nr:TetR/AcrR family transcriptional regulator [Lachnospiraceae bacterium]